MILQVNGLIDVHMSALQYDCYKTPKDSTRWPGFVDSYSHNVLRSSMLITQMKNLGIGLKGLHINNYNKKISF